MVTEATKELFALLNGLCGGLLFLALLGYLIFAKPRRLAVALLLLMVIVLCVFNAGVVYFLL